MAVVLAAAVENIGFIRGGNLFRGFYLKRRKRFVREEIFATIGAS
jgi:hypothetical protein